MYELHVHTLRTNRTWKLEEKTKEQLYNFKTRQQAYNKAKELGMSFVHKSTPKFLYGTGAYENMKLKYGRIDDLTNHYYITKW